MFYQFIFTNKYKLLAIGKCIYSIASSCSSHYPILASIQSILVFALASKIQGKFSRKKLLLFFLGLGS